MSKRKDFLITTFIFRNSYKITDLISINEHLYRQGKNKIYDISAIKHSFMRNSDIIRIFIQFIGKEKIDL